MDNTQRTNKLLALKQAIETVKSEHDRLQGTLTTYEETLKTKYNLNNIAEAKTFIENEKTELEKLQNEIDSTLPILEEKLKQWM